MVFKQLNLYNFMSYRHCELDLSELNLCSIIGKSGSGKSTIVEALLWCIYGTAKLANKDLIHSGSEVRMSVELTFELEGKTYQIERSYDDAMRVSVRVDGAPIASGNQAIMQALNRAIGANREMLMESIVISQGQLSSFVNSTPAQRRDLIITMLGLGKYAGAWEMAKDGLKTMAIEVSTYNQNIDTIKGQIKQGSDDATIAQQITRLRREIEEGQRKFEELTGKQAKAIAENEQTVKELEKYTEEQKRIRGKLDKSEKDFDAEIRKLEFSLFESDKQTRDLDGIRADILQLEKDLEASREGIERLKSLREKIREYDERLKQRREYSRLIDAGKNKCPLCNSDISNEQWQEILRAANKEMADLIKSLDDVSREVHQVVVPGDPEKIRVNIADFRDKVSKAEILLGSRHILGEQIESLKSQREKALGEINKELEGITASLIECGGRVAAALGTLETDVKNVQGAQMERSNQLVGWMSMQTTREQSRKSLEDAESNLKIYRDKLPEMEFVVAALSASGIPLMIIDYYLPVIENRAKELLGIMSDGQLNLKLEVVDVGTKKGVEILAGSTHLRPVKALSGGEQTKASLAIRIALGQILAEMANCNFHSLIIDEPEFLDPDGIDQFVQAVMTLKNQYTQIFTISHHERLKTVFPQNIVVEKNAGASTVQVLA